ncbi:MAG: response regulator [bacterium]
MKETILILEDEPVVMALIRRALSQGYAILESTTAEEAIERFGEHHGAVDLLIADVTLPVSSGIRVALELRGANPALRIILTSSYPPEMWPDQDAAELSEIPSDSVATLLKPFLPATLQKMVAGLIGLPECASAASA